MIASLNGHSEKLRQLLKTSDIIEVPGCYDVCSAMILSQIGFSAVFLSGYSVAASLLGKPDIGLTNLVETSTVAKHIVHAIDVPLIVDADDGYGNENIVARTVYEMESSGAAAMVMEDQISPKQCGHSDNKKILPLAEYMKKLECALNARQTPLVMIARTDETDLHLAIARAKTFYEAGADVTIIDGIQSLDALKRIGEEVPGPKQVNLILGGKTPILPLAELQQYGFKIALYSTPTLYVAFKALHDSMKRLHQTHDLNSIADSSIDYKTFQAFIEPQYLKKIKKVK